MYIQEIIVFTLFAFIVFFWVRKLLKRKSATGCAKCDFNEENQ